MMPEIKTGVRGIAESGGTGPEPERGALSRVPFNAGETEGRTQGRVWVSAGLVLSRCCLPLMPERVKGELEESGVRELGSR